MITRGEWVVDKEKSWLVNEMIDGSPYPLASTGNSHHGMTVRCQHAQLIASAPSLLEALTNLVGLAKAGPQRLHEYRAAIDDAEKAIAIAKGKRHE